MNDTLQTPLQAAVRRASSDMEAALIAYVNSLGEYLPANELWHHPAVREIGYKNGNTVSTVLSHCFAARKVGRVPSTGRGTRYAYGPVGEEAQAGRIRPAAPARPKYRTWHDIRPDDLLHKINLIPGLKYRPGIDGGWQYAVEYRTAEEALQAYIDRGDIEEVKE